MSDLFNFLIKIDGLILVLFSFQRSFFLVYDHFVFGHNKNNTEKQRQCQLKINKKIIIFVIF